jgi:hypothetical protein
MALLDDFKARRPQLRDVDYFHTAVVLSVVLHLSCALVWSLNRQYHFLHPDLFKFLEEIDPTRVLVQRKKPNEQPVIDTRLQQMIQFKLAEVDPSQASVVVPQKAEFYGAQNTVAANENPTEKDTGKARVEGDQTDMVRLNNVARPIDKPPAPKPPQPPEPDPAKPVKENRPEPKNDPRPTPPEKKPEPKPERQPPAPPKPSIVQVAKVMLPQAAPPEPKEEPKPPPPPEPVPLRPEPPAPEKQSRPRTLEEARQREAQRLNLVGRQMKQDGGVRRRGAPSLNVLGTSFGAYDTKMVEVIQHAWWLLLEGRGSAVGKVVVKFRLMSDGRVTQVETAESNVDDLYTTIAQMAVNGPKFDAWPPELRRQLRDDYRDIVISFFYK